MSAFFWVELTMRSVDSLRSSLAFIASLTALLMSSRSMVASLRIVSLEGAGLYDESRCIQGCHDKRQGDWLIDDVPGGALGEPLCTLHLPCVGRSLDGVLWNGRLCDDRPFLTGLRFGRPDCLQARLGSALHADQSLCWRVPAAGAAAHFAQVQAVVLVSA